MFRTILACSALLLAVAPVCHAAAILMDFGNSTYTGTDSPGHEGGNATGSSWNGFATDKSSGFVDEDGTAITGSLAVDFGTGNHDGVDYAAPTKAASYTNNDYPLWNTSLGTDHVVRNGNATIGLAIAVTGLEAGTYDFYLTGFRGDNASASSKNYDVRWTVSDSAVTDFSGLTAEVMENNNPATVDTWIVGDNYITGRFTIDQTNTGFYIHIESPGDPAYIGVANSLEIVPVPEPASLSLCAFGGALLWRGRTER